MRPSGDRNADSPSARATSFAPSPPQRWRAGSPATGFERRQSEEAAEDLQRLPGIGPFSAELILIRGVGDPDALPRHERRLARAVNAAYELPDNADIAPTAEGWRPYRAWVSLLLRAWHEDETKEITSGRRNTARPRLDPEEDT